MTQQNSYRHTIGTLEIVFLLSLLLFVLAIKVFFLIYANPLPDEAYYWLWSKNIGLSYFDHPPLAAWTQAFLITFSDNNYLVIRVLPIVSLAIVLTIMIAWQRHMSKQPTYGLCLKSVVLFLAFPIYAIFFSISFPDYLLITLLFTSSFCLFLYFENNKKLNKGIHYWYLAVLFFSLALLTKYNAVLLGVGVLAYILYNRKQIGGPSFGHILSSILIVFLVQTPVIMWNLSNEFASFSFHLGERLDNGKNFITVFKNASGFLMGFFLAFSPIFIFNLKGFNTLEGYNEERKSFIKMSKFVLYFSVTFCLFLTVFTNVLYYWVTPAIVLLIPFLINILRSKIWQYLHIFYGIFISLILVINISVYPISAFFGDVDRETAILFGWKKIIEVIEKEKKLRDLEKVVFSDYRLGSLYIFHSGDFKADVIMEERRTQFDLWRGDQTSFSASTLIIADNDFPIGQKLLSRFENIEFVRTFEVYIGKKIIKKYKIFLGINT